MALSMTNTQFGKGQLSFQNRLGGAAQVEAGTLKISSDNEAVGTVEKDADDETKFKVTPTGTGVATINWEADADLGEGVKTITGFFALEVTAAEAVGASVEFSVEEQ